MAVGPSAVVTVTSTVPTPAGEVAVIWVALLTVKEAAALLPKLTAVAPEKLVPVMVTLLPPVVLQGFGVNRDLLAFPPRRSPALELMALVPPEVVTVTSTVPTPAGE